MAAVWRGGRLNGVCTRCSESRFDKNNRCVVCATTTRRARLLGITWEEAFLLPRVYRGQHKNLPKEQLTAKQRYLQTEKGKAYSRRWTASRRAQVESSSILKGE